jgi:hypothetical protein
MGEEIEAVAVAMRQGGEFLESLEKRRGGERDREIL